jgi:poly-gamma-glutamate capsule biosynthesis protein CapA/YwtB (metallophosphatase superfamily)
MRIKERFTVTAVGDLIQMVPFSQRNDPDIQTLVQLMQQSDLTLANNESTVVDRLTFRGPIAHMESDACIADDWANMGIHMVTKANNHTFDCGELGLIQNLQQLRRVGIDYVGTDYNLIEARLARFRGTPKGTVGFVGAYASVSDYSQQFGLPGGEPVIVTEEQLEQLCAMRDSIVARRSEIKAAITEPPKDTEGRVLVFGRVFKLNGAGVEADAEAASIKKRMDHHHNAKGDITSKNNTLGLIVHHGITELQMMQLRAIAGVTATQRNSDTLDAFGIHFKITEKPGEYCYVMNEQDRRDILREVRTGKQFSHFQAFTIHWHQNRFSFQSYSFDHYPADYQIKFAHEVIDNGADFFFAHGVHTLKGVEIYRGKPIFYGLSNFVFQHQLFRSWRDDEAGRALSELTGAVVGDGESNEARWAWLNHPENCEALLVQCDYESGKLSKVLLHPADLGRTPRAGADKGTPKKPSPDVSRDILERVAEYSKPFFTEIRIECGVGIVQLPV